MMSGFNTKGVSTQRSLVIWGTGGHAAVVADIVRSQADFELIGWLDDLNIDRHHTEFLGASVLGGREALLDLRARGVNYLIVGIGDNVVRLRLAQHARALGFHIVHCVHPRAVVATSSMIGSGTVIAAGAVVNPAVIIGENAIINTSASVDHDCIVEDGAHVGPGVCLGGNVLVERGAWLGIGATVIDRVRIGAYSIVGAGAVVVNDVPPGVIVHGVPARFVRKVIEE